MPTDDFFHVRLDQMIDLHPPDGVGKSIAVDSDRSSTYTSFLAQEQ